MFSQVAFLIFFSQTVDQNSCFMGEISFDNVGVIMVRLFFLSFRLQLCTIRDHRSSKVSLQNKPFLVIWVSCVPNGQLLFAIQSLQVSER